ncbi:GntR family transcriptional regulator [Rhodobacteraceae bacterium 2CG4]|uniref:GntR family transcriptional regulator n=1 Tax=Halovulum marinum TaxID=2662447 RepID=A0A6L5YVI4_9RHOB|nr:GntR family transcriptional regulator [Halovulum marinum]MSU88311.1 GntR family transcriptional regulator [Halovulum marinum]
MSRSNSVYKEAYNRCLVHIGDMGRGAQLPPEAELAEILNSSRTTVRAVLEHLSSSGIIDWEGRRKLVLRRPLKADFFPEEETKSASERIETQFMEYILGGDLKPGAILRESELAREFGVSSSAIREYLIRFSRFGLIRKEPNRHWVLHGFTRDFATDLFDVREMFETRAFERLARDPSAVTGTLQALAESHRALAASIDTEFLKFPRMDEQFHRLLLDRLDNRFVDDFYELVSLIFHFHYRWNKTNERDRNLAALHEHLAVIEALLDGDIPRARRAFEAHLQTARRTMMDSAAFE